MSDTRSSPSSRLALLLGLFALLGLVWWASRDREQSGSASPTQTKAPQVEFGRRSASDSELPELVRPAKASVSGTVRARGGAPLAAAQVCATGNPSELRGLGLTTPICTQTDAEGRYRLEGLWPVRTLLGASAAEHEPNFWQVRERGSRIDLVPLRAGVELRDVDIELAPGGVRVTGFVRDLGGGEIEGAWVGTGKGIGTRSDAEGRFELWLARGMERVSAQAEGYAGDMQLVSAPSDAVELFLTPESVLIGRVVDAKTGEPIVDAEVRLAGVGAGAAVRSDAQGHFRIVGLRPGYYKPLASTDELAGEASFMVALGLAQTSEPIEILMHPSALVVGQIVIEGSGEPCTKGSVLLVARDKSSRWPADVEGEGELVLRGVLPGEYVVEPRCPGYVPLAEYPTLHVPASGKLEATWAVREGQAIRGRLVDAKGQGVGEMQVRAKRLVDPARPRDEQPAVDASGLSEVGGEFEVRGLVPGRYALTTIAGSLPGVDPPVEVELTPGRDLEGVELSLAASGSLAGRVLDEQGRALAGVTVRAHSLAEQGLWSTTVCDERGEFVFDTLRVGEVRVFAVRSGQAGTMLSPGRSEDEPPGEQVEVVAGAQASVELRVVREDGVIRGRVLDEDGAAVDDAVLELARIGESSTTSVAEARRALGRAGRPHLSELDGSFAIGGLAPGRYVVRAQRRGGGEAIAEGVEVGGEVELRMVAPGLLAGTIVVASGELPDRFEVTARDDLTNKTLRDVFTRSAGRWQLGPLPAGTYTLVTESRAGTATLTVELAAGERRDDLELALQPRVTLRGRLVDIDEGTPIVGALVSVVPRTSRSATPPTDSLERKDVSDAEGRFEVSQAAVGLVRILIRPRAVEGASHYEPASIPTEIPSEPSEQDIGDLALVASRVGAKGAAGELGFTLEPVSPTTPDEQVELRVAVVRPGGPASDSGLLVGDRLVAIDGKSLSGRDHGRFEALSQVPAGTTIELELEGGKRLSITAGPAIE